MPPLSLEDPVDEAKAVAALYAECAPALAAYAQGILGGRDWAEEAVQEAFAELLAHPWRVASAVDSRAFVFGAVRLSALALHKRRRRWWRLAGSLPERPWLLAPEEAPGLEGLADAVAALPPPEREAVVLKIYGELTFEQAGEAAGVPPKTLESRYYAALSRLRDRMERRGA